MKPIKQFQRIVGWIDKPEGGIRASLLLSDEVVVQTSTVVQKHVDADGNTFAIETRNTIYVWSK